MIKTPLYIEIVRSSQPGLSSMSAASSRAIKAVLDSHYTRVETTIINNQADLEALVVRRPDVVFLGMKFIPEHPELGREDPDKTWIADYLSRHDIAFTGSDHYAHQLEFDKTLGKQRAHQAGLATAPFVVITKAEAKTRYTIPLTFPVFIKPTNRGGGQGIDSQSVVYNADQLHTKVSAIANDLVADSLIETYLPGREFSVAVLRTTDSNELVAMPIELIATADEQGARLLSGAVKSSNTERVYAVTDEHLKSLVTTLAIDAFEALGAKDYGRIDIRLDSAGVPHFLEANLIPSLTSGYGSFPKACLINKNLAYEPMILGIVQLALTPYVSVTVPLSDTPLLIEPLLQYA